MLYRAQKVQIVRRRRGGFRVWPTATASGARIIVRRVALWIVCVVADGIDRMESAMEPSRLVKAATIAEIIQLAAAAPPFCRRV
jgi:hypothetical protein